jgi:hypothetical protein
MPDRLIDLYQRLAEKVEEIDALVKEADRADPTHGRALRAVG